MYKTKDKPVEKPRKPDAGRIQSSQAHESATWSHTVRETIESIVIAFVLAFLFRTFEAEAFVIPTGSMAPTLMGRHLDLKCPKCGYHFQVGGPDDDRTPQQTGQSAVCPLCRYKIDPTTASQYYNGDRILVSKFAFDFVEPKRWDVIVFKFPDDAKTNYIKRLIGLPGEVIRIRDGDIQVSHDDGRTFEMARKDPAKMRAMLQIVYDNDYAYEPFIEKGWPARWQGEASWSNETGDGGKTDYKVFANDGKTSAGTGGVSWLRYNHYVPDEGDWNAFDSGRPLNSHPQASAIKDSIAYDEPGGASALNDVSDLAVEFEVKVPDATGTIVLELMKKGRPFRCQLNLADGSAQMLFPGLKPEAQPKATEGAISRPGTYRILFANIDHELTLLVDNKPVHFDKPTTYAELIGNGPSGQNADSSLVGIGVGGSAVKVSHLRVWRDVFYTYLDRPGISHPRYSALADRPARWPEERDWACTPASAVTRLREAGTDVQPGDQYFFVGKPGDGRAPTRDGIAAEDQYLPLGDNSPSSQDGRYWGNRHFVDRRLLVGKALYIYWPHSFDKIRFSDSFSIPFPFFPNFARMGFVR